jgi:hypothetical protein
MQTSGDGILRARRISGTVVRNWNPFIHSRCSSERLTGLQFDIKAFPPFYALLQFFSSGVPRQLHSSSPNGGVSLTFLQNSSHSPGLTLHHDPAIHMQVPILILDQYLLPTP